MYYQSMPTTIGYDSPQLNQHASVTSFATSLAKSETSIRSVESADFPFEKSRRGLGTRDGCVVALVFSWLCGFGIIAAGLWVRYLYKHPEMNSQIMIPHMTAELVPLGINLFVTILILNTGYIHTVSLRWALQHEGRLNFNSNLRLFTSAKQSAPNRWYSNLFLLACITLAYASASLIFAHSNGATSLDGIFELEDDLIQFAYVPMCMLGASILGINAICTWAFFATKIPSWSSSPLDAAYAAMRSGRIHYRQGRCMLSVHDTKLQSGAAYPRARQRGAWQAHAEAKWLLVVLWLLVLCCFLTAGVVLHLIHEQRPDLSGFGSWSLIPSLETQFLYFTPPGGQSTATAVGLLLLYAVLQSPLTIGVHCAELHVNLSRDEAFWRKASSHRGCRLEDYNSIFAAYTSWQAIVLFVFKSVMHWVFGLAVKLLSYQLYILPIQLVYLAVLAGLCALFTTYISVRRPFGPQPAAYGHLQTLVDVIDTWSAVMFWGHKAENYEYCHAGTWGQRLPDIKNAPYY